MRYTYDLHAISTHAVLVEHHPSLAAGADLAHYAGKKKVLIGFYRLPCQVPLKYLCKIECFLFWQSLF